MGTDHWHSVYVKRLRREPSHKYEQRRDEIVAIIEGFRVGRFRGQVAERLDERLQGLMTGAVDVLREPLPEFLQERLGRASTPEMA